jgi:hypothetical protein
MFNSIKNVIDHLKKPNVSIIISKYVKYYISYHTKDTNTEKLLMTNIFGQNIKQTLSYTKLNLTFWTYALESNIEVTSSPI